MMECYCLSFFTTNKDTLQVTFPNVLCCCPYCWRLSSPFEPAGFLFKNKIIQSLINDQLMLIELLNHCLNWLLNRLTVYIIYSVLYIFLLISLGWLLMRLLIIKVILRKINDHHLPKDTDLCHPLANEGENKINSMNEYMNIQ